MDQALLQRLDAQTAELTQSGLFKRERVIASGQDPVVQPRGRARGHQPLRQQLSWPRQSSGTAPRGARGARPLWLRHGIGAIHLRDADGAPASSSSVCLRSSATDDTILYSSCFDANGGLFETLTDDQDAIISDALNHASIIDGIRLSKAKRLRYDNGDMGQLERRLRESQEARTRLVVTDGVFSMDGTIARLRDICDLADRYRASVVVDDSHATGFMGATGRGTHEHCGVMERVDILTSTLGKALGGASGGFVSGRAPVIGWLRQRSRPYLFSNSIAPVVAATTLRVLEMLESTPGLRRQLMENAAWFRAKLTALGFQLLEGEHPIIPVMLGDATLAGRMADRLLELGIYAIGFSYPVVPMGKARIRTQMCAGHTARTARDRRGRVRTGRPRTWRHRGMKIT